MHVGLRSEVLNFQQKACLLTAQSLLLLLWQLFWQMTERNWTALQRKWCKYEHPGSCQLQTWLIICMWWEDCRKTHTLIFPTANRNWGATVLERWHDSWKLKERQKTTPVSASSNVFLTFSNWLLFSTESSGGKKIFVNFICIFITSC